MSAGTALVDPACIRLDLPPGDRAAAVRATAELLSGDGRGGDWEEFWRAVGQRQIIDLEGCAGRVVLAHGRSAAVRQLALAAGRQTSAVGPSWFFVFAIPATMAEEYLRKVGALARVCRCSDRRRELEGCSSAADVARLLETWLA